MTERGPAPSDPTVPPNPRGSAPVSRLRVSDRHPPARSWADVVVPVGLLLLVAGFGAILYTGRARGGLTRLPTKAERRRDLCRGNLADLVVAWRAAGTIPAKLRHERWGGQDGLGCANDDGAPYAVRDLVRFPVDPARTADEPIAACLGLRGTAERWRPPHGDVVLVAYADGEVRELAWPDLGLPGEPVAGTPAPVVGPESASPILRVMCIRR